MFLHEELPLALSATRETSLSKALTTLDEKERKAIFLRFWNPSSIQEISKILKMSWSDTDRLIETTLRKLKQKIMELEKGELKV